jgi:glycosyltransferase involved in cell wall biosynthesis
VIANSHATLAAVRPYLAAAATPPEAVVAHLGTHKSIASAAATPGARPYFVCIGTIEPRKNHLLLLNIWRRMAEERGADTIPKLIVIGRRGWENEQIVDMLERCPALVGCVEEHNGMTDETVAGVLAGARALLFPSFAEGYGMPVTEALSLDVPVICSDLPALREAGGPVPDYLDPLDGRRWREAIDDYVRIDAPARAAQMTRMPAWNRPAWDDHIAAVLNLANSVAR